VSSEQRIDNQAFASMSSYINDGGEAACTPKDWIVDDVLPQLTLDEKVSLLAGKDFWHTQDIPRLGIESIRLSDGPNGIRGTKFFDSVPSACLPCGTAIGATFDSKLAVRIGQLLGDQARAKGAHVVLGPTINIQRAPLGGRGFESFSEDPVLSGTIAGSYCLGLKDKKIVPTLKHFVCNDMEHERMAVNAVVSDRALREIYLLPFQIALRMAQPGAIMTAYNKVNGRHAAEHRDLLENVLRREWGWNGLVMSDWQVSYKASFHSIALESNGSLGLAHTALRKRSMPGWTWRCLGPRDGVVRR
jgi:beta-glucosidase